jgi:hypothetical protein
MDLSTEEPALFFGADAGDRAGTLATGDFNGDGLADVAMAAALADGAENSQPDAGEVYVFLGPIESGDRRDAASGQQAVTILGINAGDQTGRSLAAGDFTGDGVDDLAIGSPFWDGADGSRSDSGRIDIISGSSELASVGTATLDGLSAAAVLGASPGDFAGISLASGELNGDGASDLVVGAFWAAGPSDSRPTAGEAYGVLGSPALPPSRDLAETPADITVYGASAEDRLGEGVATGDIDGDGLDDLILPAPFASNPGGVRDAGRIYVIESPAPASVDLESYEVSYTIHGVDDGDQLGHVPAGGDIDGDGRDDLLLTAVSADGPANSVDLAGEAVVFLAADLQSEASGEPGEATAIFYGERPEDRLGRSAAIGDIDGDGRAEFILGAPGASSREGGPTAGRIYVLSAADLQAEMRVPGAARVYYGADAGDALSSSVFGRMPVEIKDLDGDGRGEVLVMAPLGNGPANDRADCGEAAILFISEDALP